MNETYGVVPSERMHSELDEYGRTPLHIAAQFGDERRLAHLLFSK